MRCRICWLILSVCAVTVLTACSETPSRRAGDGAIGDAGDGASKRESGASDGLAVDRSAPPVKPCTPTYPVEQCQQVVDSETWAFAPEKDTYDPGALLDLRRLNEQSAGAGGFVKLSADGRDLVRGDGQPLRLWAAHSTVYEKDPGALEDHARFLAKRGVNMVRWHGHLPRAEAGAPLGTIDTEAREQLWQYVAAMKKEGIYLTLSPYYALRGVAGFNDNMHGLLFFDATLQQAYKDWLTALLTPTNPHTGVALKDEPAVAVIQLQNEDSLLFWTVNALEGKWKQQLGLAFGEWLIARHGSLEQALARYADATLPGDDLAGGIVDFYNIWEMTQPQTSGSAKDLRLSDQLQFWTEKMRAFNADIVTHLRDVIGAKQLVNAGNWKTADPIRLNDAERYSYTSTDVMAVNRYYGGGVHEGEQQGWAIINGDRFEGRSLLTDPRSLPVNLKQVAGHPMLVTESNWVPPLGYQSEGPFLVSVFMSLSGVDGFYWFNIGQPQYREPSSANGYLPSLGKWVANTPEILGNFPAAALLHRRGYVRRA